MLKFSFVPERTQKHGQFRDFLGKDFYAETSVNGSNPDLPEVDRYFAFVEVKLKFTFSLLG